MSPSFLIHTSRGPDHVPTAGTRRFDWGSLTLIVRGVVRWRGSEGPLDVESVAEEIRAHYLDTATLPTERLEGGFGLVLLDAAAGRVLAYRNLAAAADIYYRVDGDDLVVGGHPAEVAGPTARVERAALPGFFRFGLAGRETLFAGVRRLLPGELLVGEPGRLTLRRMQTFADLAREPFADPIAALDRTLAEVLSDAAALYPRPATLLSGGLASAYVQAIANVSIRDELLPATYSASFDHAAVWAATEVAMTASRALGTAHSLVPVGDDLAGDLRATTAALGQPPRDGALLWSLRLGRALAARGHGAGLSGLGADALFAPAPPQAGWLRRTLGRLFGPAQTPDEVRDCFGDAVRDAAARRRDLLVELAVGEPLLDDLARAGLQATLFQEAGVDLVCPFLDSRVLALAARLQREGRPGSRDLLARALARHLLHGTPADKLADAPPVGDWLVPGGPLRPLAEQMPAPDFLEPGWLARLLRRPGAFLFALLGYDHWQRAFLDRSSVPVVATPLVEPVRPDAA